MSELNGIVQSVADQASINVDVFVKWSGVYWFELLFAALLVLFLALVLSGGGKSAKKKTAGMAKKWDGKWPVFWFGSVISCGLALLVFWVGGAFFVFFLFLWRRDGERRMSEKKTDAVMKKAMRQAGLGSKQVGA